MIFGVFWPFLGVFRVFGTFGHFGVFWSFWAVFGCFSEIVFNPYKCLGSGFFEKLDDFDDS